MKAIYEDKDYWELSWGKIDRESNIHLFWFA